MDLDLELFPQRDPKTEGVRKLYFMMLDKFHAASLRQKGYEPVLLLALPRSNQQDEVFYLECVLQGATEGTVILSKQQLATLELSMKKCGLLSPTSQRLNVNVNADSETIKGLLNWGESRHTLRGNTTIDIGKKLLGDDDGNNT